jgi:hypothetical protein
MIMEKIVEIPADHRLTLEIPNVVSHGRAGVRKQTRYAKLGYFTISFALFAMVSARQTPLRKKAQNAVTSSALSL